MIVLRPKRSHEVFDFGWGTELDEGPDQAESPRAPRSTFSSPHLSRRARDHQEVASQWHHRRRAWAEQAAEPPRRAGDRQGEARHSA